MYAVTLTAIQRPADPVSVFAPYAPRHLFVDDVADAVKRHFGPVGKTRPQNGMKRDLLVIPTELDPCERREQSVRS